MIVTDVASLKRYTSPIRVAAALLVVLGGPCAIASDSCDPATFAPAAHRFFEDCAALGRLNVDAPERQGLQSLRYIPIDEDAGHYITLGGELRLRWERMDPQRFGIAGGAPVSTNAERLNAHVDLHWDRFRWFVQLNASAASGWPIPRPADHSAVDVSQGFMQLRIGQAAEDTFIRLGRQEIALPPNRLIGANEATNIRRTFDGALAQVQALGATTTAFLMHPVTNRPGALDDRSSSAERFNGVNLHVPLDLSASDLSLRVRSLDAFIFRRFRSHAVFQDASGSEARSTYGARLAGEMAALDYMLQVDWQKGHVGTDAVAAKAATLDLAWASKGLRWEPLVALSFGWAGGDRRLHDGVAGTFDTLYANLSYATEAGYLFPGNSRDASVAISVRPLSELTGQVGVFGYWRIRSADAVYQPPGLILVGGGGASGNRVAVLPFLKLAYRLDRYSEFTVSAVRLVAGPVITSAGGRSATYGLAQWQFRF